MFHIPRIAAGCVLGSMLLFPAGPSRADGPAAPDGWEKAQRALSAAEAAAGNPASMEEWFAARERTARAYRDAGLLLWKEAAGDDRKWNWLLKTLESAPYYTVGTLNPPLKGNDERLGQSYVTGQSAVIDVTARNRDELALEIIRRAELPALPASDSRRQQIELAYLQNDIRRLQSMRTVSGFDPRRYPGLVEGVAATLLAYARTNPQAGGGELQSSIQEVIKGLSADPSAQHTFARELAGSGNAHAAQVAGDFLAVARFRATPFAVHGLTVQGKRYELPGKDGRMLLVQLWNTQCASCIEAMPKFEALRTAHRQRLDLVSLCFRHPGNRRPAEEDRATAARIMEKKQATYPAIYYPTYQELESTGLRWDISAYYLFDEERRLVAYFSSSGELIQAAQDALAGERAARN